MGVSRKNSFAEESATNALLRACRSTSSDAGPEFGRNSPIRASWSPS